MFQQHVHEAGTSGSEVELLPAALLLLAVIVYVTAAVSGGRRGRTWPRSRTAFWIAGMTAAAAGFVGPLASAAHDSFTAHMWTHLLVGMVAPLMLVLAAPMTLALRSLDVVPARRLSRLLGGPVGRILTNPIVAATLNVGGLWTLYLTPLHGIMQQIVLVHWLVMLHLLCAGYLYTASLVSVDPSPHRAGFVLRAVVLVASLAAHGVLAKALYASPRPGIARDDAHAGAQLMFYGGDAVELVLIVLLCAKWYRVPGRRLARESTVADRSAGRIR